MSDSAKLQDNPEIQNGLQLKSSEDFSYLQQSQAGYGLPHSDQYMPSYYGGGGQVPFPYMGEWSAGDSVPFLSGYSGVPSTEPQHHQPFIPDTMFAQPTTNLGNGHQYFNQQPMFPHSNEFTAWGPSSGGHNNVLDPGINQQNAYNADFYQHMNSMSVMPPSYLSGELLSNSTTNGTDLMRYNNSGGVQVGNEISGKLPSESPQAINVNNLEQNLQSMKLDMSSGSETEKFSNKAETSNSINIGIVQNGINDNHDGSTIKTTSIEAQSSKPISWAAIASKPAKPQPKPKTKPAAGPGLPPPIKHNMDIGTWELGRPPNKANNSSNMPQRWNGQRQNGRNFEDKQDGDHRDNYQVSKVKNSNNPQNSSPVLEKLINQNDYNPKRLTIDLRSARFFVIKSYSEDDIHRSIKYNIWCSTEHGNKRLDSAFYAQANRGPVLLLYSVNGSGHFCGVAEMKSAIDYNTTAGVWSQDKWKGSFQVKWIYVKDVPNNQLRHIRLENNDNKPVTNSRDTQEVPAEKGRQVLKIIANFKHQTSIFDDFGHYERRQLVEEDQKVKSSQARKNDASHPSGTNNKARK